MRPQSSPNIADLARRIAARAEQEPDIVAMPDAVVERVAAMLRPMPVPTAADPALELSGDGGPSPE